MDLLKKQNQKKTGQMFLVIVLASLTLPHSSNSCIVPGMDGSASHAQGASNSNTEKRSCPEGSAYHNATSTCHKLLEKGPCGDLQLFYSTSKDPKYGTCACMSNGDGCNPIVKSNRMILPGPDARNCFYAYSSGPCPDGQWYVLNMKTLKPECQENPCFSDDGKRKPDPFVGNNEIVLGLGNGETDKFTFVLNNTCYDTYTQAYCGDGKYVQFLGTNDPYPKCYYITRGQPSCSSSGFSITGVAPVTGMPCEAGYKMVGDDCVVANIEFD